MIPEMELPILLSRAVVQSIPASRIRESAIELIEAGIDVSELHDISWDPVIESEEAWRLFTRVLPRIGWRLPTRDEAAQILLHHYASSVVHSGSPPLPSFERMCRDVIEPEMGRFEHGRDAGTLHDMEALAGDYYLYDDLADRGFPLDEMQPFLVRVRSDIEDRLRRHPTPPSLKLA